MYDYQCGRSVNLDLPCLQPLIDSYKMNNKENLYEDMSNYIFLKKKLSLSGYHKIPKILSPSVYKPLHVEAPKLEMQKYLV